MSAHTLSWPKARVVSRVSGSLPDGGQLPDTPIFAFSSPVDSLIFNNGESVNITREDIDLGSNLLAFRLNGVLTPEECSKFIAAGEFLGFQAQAPGIQTPPGMRKNKTVHWISDSQLMDQLYHRLCPFLPPSIDGLQLMPKLSHRLNMYKYDNGDVFNDHIDGDWPGFSLNAERTEMQQWINGRSCLTMLLYLNGTESGVKGGATRLYDRNNNGYDSSPRTGDALFFRHGFGPDSVRHKGCEVVGDKAKYVIRINIMYS